MLATTNSSRNVCVWCGGEGQLPVKIAWYGIRKSDCRLQSVRADVDRVQPHYPANIECAPPSRYIGSRLLSRSGKYLPGIGLSSKEEEDVRGRRQDSPFLEN